MPLPLGLGQIHAWYRATNPSDYDGYLSTLSREELARCRRFHFARDRYDYANAHDLLRRTLSRYDSTPPQDWRFDAPRHGKPFLSPATPGEGGRAPLMFNLSHTSELVACVIARGVTVGIDIERTDRLRDALALATRFFSPTEVGALDACVSERDRAWRFIELWTLKESFVKATGHGLSQPLDSVTFELEGHGAIRFSPPSEFATSTWHFAQYTLTPSVLMAIAAQTEHTVHFVVRDADGDQTAQILASRATQSRHEAAPI